ncbi:MAG: MarR family transcriptional regulator [Cellulomonas sp. 73-145]|uniref:MarR family winged helix-turn-helix transcriptional regulator n=1 Tax=Cellulomonas sp. 73-145 TaxID=1895739 RepID=UPI0009265DF1|nr:MarR family winged helix-turn-helix transcriptional regulator [Cellulomonas sp. 73-145]MBN9328363.1 winged helix-turn-helix transcriptional regulator [Cellulomonas sp.]OJV57063.1 MAG: MarR family transcriptional regulator [Cellulomonas sp. 73-145]
MQTSLQRLGQSLKRAQWRDHRTMDTALRSVGVSLVQWDVLRAIDSHPDASGHELAGMTFMSDQAFATLSARLLRAGLIERSSGGGRRLHHALTPEGRRLLAEGGRVVEEVLDELFAPLDAAQRGQLQDLLDTLTGTGPSTR